MLRQILRSWELTTIWSGYLVNSESSLWHGPSPRNHTKKQNAAESFCTWPDLSDASKIVNRSYWLVRRGSITGSTECTVVKQSREIINIPFLYAVAKRDLYGMLYEGWWRCHVAENRVKVKLMFNWETQTNQFKFNPFYREVLN